MTKTAAKGLPFKSVHKSPFQKAIYPSQHPTSNLVSSAAYHRVLPRSLNSSGTFNPPRRVVGLNHFNITASPPLVERLKRFYIDIIGLTVGPRAQLDHEGYWLYAGSFPVLHLSAREQTTCQIEAKTEWCPAEGCFNHISLSCVGLADTIEWLIVTKTPYKIAKLPDISQVQLLVKDPVGVGVELTFSGESLPEAVRIQA